VRVAIFTELYPPNIGGQELFFAGIARQLVLNGHEVDVFCIGTDPAVLANETVDGVTVSRRPIAPTYKRPHIAATRRSVRAMLRYALYIRGVAKSGSYDAFFLNEWPLFHVVALPRAARRRALLHWCEFRTGQLNGFIQKRLPRLVCMNAAISGSVAMDIRALSHRQVEVLESGIERDLYRSKPREQRSGILSLGRLAAHKNLPFLIAAYERLRERGYTGRLTIAGEGPEAGHIARRIAQSPFAAQIDLLGVVSDETKIKLLSSYEILAMPSGREGFPRVIAEAMASGLPSVTVDLPQNGTKDIVRQYQCGAVTAYQEEAFCAGIEAVFTQWSEVSERGLLACDALDWKTITTKLETLLFALAAAPDRSRRARPSGIRKTTEKLGK
jgi:glycosyltransferase involved in cell wall biosynthesis